MSPTNEQRAEAAAHGLDAYGIAKEGRDDYDAPEDMATDMLCDLLHLIRGHDADPLKALETAKTNFEVEEQEQRECLVQLRVGDYSVCMDIDKDGDLQLRVYPIDHDGQIWDHPVDTFNVLKQDVDLMKEHVAWTGSNENSCARSKTASTTANGVSTTSGTT